VAFCAGGDIQELAQRPVLQGRMRMELAVRIFRLLVTGPKPFLCAVEGARQAAACRWRPQ
jgi:enoyl-CoA hydratase/carnithine racemase